MEALEATAKTIPLLRRQVLVALLALQLVVLPRVHLEELAVRVQRSAVVRLQVRVAQVEMQLAVQVLRVELRATVDRLTAGQDLLVEAVVTYSPVTREMAQMQLAVRAEVAAMPSLSVGAVRRMLIASKLEASCKNLPELEQSNLTTISVAIFSYSFFY